MALIMFKGQLELSLVSYQVNRSTFRPRRAARARWWFDRMRQVVDNAADYPPAPELQSAPTAATFGK
jgi:hypothetical protein